VIVYLNNTGLLTLKMAKRNNDNNPKYPTYWINQGFNEEIANEKAMYERKCSTTRCPEYWMKRGYSYEEAIEKVSELQSSYAKKNKGIKKTPEHKEKIKEFFQYLNTVNYWIDKYGDEIGKLKYDEYCENQKKNASLGNKKRLENNPNTFIESSIRRPEYWIKQGYSEEEAKLMVSKTQSRGLDFYINKYGEEEGLKRWKLRNEKWYDSFYNGENDLDEINEKRKLNCHVGYYTQKTIENIPTLNFYLISLIDKNNTTIVKYGLTKQTNIAKRWKVSLNYNLIMFKELDSRLAIELENEFHAKFKNSYKPQIIKTTECFEYTDDNLKDAYILIENFLNK